MYADFDPFPSVKYGNAVYLRGASHYEATFCITSDLVAAQQLRLLRHRSERLRLLFACKSPLSDAHTQDMQSQSRRFNSHECLTSDRGRAYIQTLLVLTAVTRCFNG